MGIYRIICLSNDMIYIGQTINFKERKRRHLKDLRKGNHSNIIMQRSFNKYGETSFIFELILSCSKEELTIKEQEILSFYLENKSNLVMNLIHVVEDSWVHTQETKKKLSEIRKGKPGTPHTEAHKEKMRTGLSCHPCKLISPDNVIHEFISITEASKKTGVHFRNLWRVINKERSHAKGWKLYNA